MVSSAPVELTLEQGVIYGESDENVELYRGIPYARPPIGELRWRPTVGIDSFDGLEQHIHRCHQGDDNDEKEDCLTLNIYRPVDLAENEVLPIMIWFHGGGHQYGSSHDLLYDATLLSSNYRQIVVSANFRLGIFGFMSFWEDGPTGGNYALLDQQKVIEFVRQNAVNIQGDENRITIFGESAGAESVLYHMLNEKSSSMITNAIVQSGCYWWNSNPTSQTKEANNVINEICTRLDQCSVAESIYQTLDSLRQCDGKAVFETYNQMREQDPLQYNPFYPVVKDGVFFEDDAREILEQCKAPFDGSAIIGGNSFEGNLLYLAEGADDKMKPNQIRSTFATLWYFDQVPIWQQEFVIEKYFNVYHDYFPYAPHYRFLKPNDAYLIAALINGDLGYRKPSLQKSSQLQKCGTKVYSYYLDVETQWDLSTQRKSYYNGTGHAQELLYTFAATELGTYPVMMNGLEPEPFEYDLTFLFQSQWSRLNHRGEPWIDWTTMGTKYDAFVIHQDQAKMESLLDQVMMDFWLNEYSKTWMIEQKAELTLKQGSVYGRKYIDRGIEHYRGIPYAQPPIGKLRWKPTRELNSFDDLNRFAIQHSTPCVQLVFNDYAEGEDCLVLDIYRPITEEKNLPVAIYIHGGGLLQGAGSDASYNMTRYAADGIISVTINYRLTILGFMNRWDDEQDMSVGGNYGLLDQQMAIKFISDNCEMIGCDPNKITIFGESAGGESTSWHTLTSAPMFQRAIVQSGPAIWDQNNLQETPAVNDIIRDLHKLFFHDGSSSTKSIDQIFDDLETVEARPLVLAWDILALTDVEKYQKFSVVKNDGVFYTENAREKWKTGNLDFKGTVVMGVNSFEGSLMESFMPPNWTIDDWTVERISFAYELVRFVKQKTVGY